MTKLTTRKSTSTRLTDAQLIVLSRAAQRDDGAATCGNTVRGHGGEGGREARGDARREGARPGDQGEAWHAGMEAQRGGSLPCADHRQARPNGIEVENDRESEDTELSAQASAATDKVTLAQSKRNTPRQDRKGLR